MPQRDIRCSKQGVTVCETAPLCIGVFLCKCVFRACALHKLALPEGCIQMSPVEQRWHEVKFLHLELFNSVDFSIREKAFKLTLSSCHLSCSIFPS